MLTKAYRYTHFITRTHMHKQSIFQTGTQTNCKTRLEIFMIIFIFQILYAENVSIQNMSNYTDKQVQLSLLPGLSPHLGSSHFERVIVCVHQLQCIQSIEVNTKATFVLQSQGVACKHHLWKLRKLQLFLKPENQNDFPSGLWASNHRSSFSQPECHKRYFA